MTAVLRNTRKCHTTPVQNFQLSRPLPLVQKEAPGFGNCDNRNIPSEFLDLGIPTRVWLARLSRPVSPSYIRSWYGHTRFCEEGCKCCSSTDTARTNVVRHSTP
eukprot:1970239-Rhodomonas_salina.1